MCSRFAIGEILQEVLEGADIVGPADMRSDALPAANWNVAPTQPVGFVRRDGDLRRLEIARWGLIPHWWRKPLAEFRATTFNARSETAAEKPMFRDAWIRGRCVLPALGYYEWTGKKGDKTPWFVTLKRNTPVIWFAGLWSRAMVDGASVTSCTILTAEAGEATRQLHPRAPVILAEGDVDTWLSGGEGSAGLMHAAPDDRTEFWEVDRAMGSFRVNGPELIERVGLGL